MRRKKICKYSLIIKIEKSEKNLNEIKRNRILRIRLAGLGTYCVAQAVFLEKLVNFLRILYSMCHAQW